jgi:hypothetical protein
MTGMQADADPLCAAGYGRVGDGCHLQSMGSQVRGTVSALVITPQDQTLNRADSRFPVQSLQVGFMVPEILDMLM